MSRPAAVAVIVALALASSSRAAADDPAPVDDQVTDLYRQSEASYHRGDYERAADLLRQAYGLKPEASFLFDMGRAYERAGDLAPSIDAYARYLVVEPQSKDRSAVERSIATMRRQLAELDQLKKKHDQELRQLMTSQASERDQADKDRRGAALILPSVTIGVGLASLATAAIFGAVAVSRQSAAEREPQQAAAQDDLKQARTFATVSNVTLITGGIFTVGGAVWWLVTASSHKSTSTVSLAAPSSGKFQAVIRW